MLEYNTHTFHLAMEKVPWMVGGQQSRPFLLCLLFYFPEALSSLYQPAQGTYYHYNLLLPTFQGKHG
jgi:hypothetical protein